MPEAKDEMIFVAAKLRLIYKIFNFGNFSANAKNVSFVLISEKKG